MGSFATGLGEVFHGASSNRASAGSPSYTFPAQVMDICLNKSQTALYKSPKDIGKIIFRHVFDDKDKPETQMTKAAYPLDRSIMRYPLPGEEVLIVVAKGQRNTANEAEEVIGACYFYTFTISSNHNVTYNVEPFLATTNKKINPSNTVAAGINEKRFKEKTLDIAAVTDGEDTKIYKQLTPSEGDFILQGRFGNTIRFSSTKSTDKIWDRGAGQSGDGITIIKQDIATTLGEADMLTTVDEDALDTAPASQTATIILTTKQKINNILACTDLTSMRVKFGVRSPSTWIKDLSKLTT